MLSLLPEGLLCGRRLKIDVRPSAYASGFFWQIMQGVSLPWHDFGVHILRQNIKKQKVENPSYRLCLGMSRKFRKKWYIYRDFGEKSALTPENRRFVNKSILNRGFWEVFDHFGACRGISTCLPNFKIGLYSFVSHIEMSRKKVPKFSKPPPSALKKDFKAGGFWRFSHLIFL